MEETWKDELLHTFSISPPAKPTTIARPFHAMHLRESAIESVFLHFQVKYRGNYLESVQRDRR